MANASDYLEGLIASHMFGSGTWSKPAVIAVALCSGEPTDAMTGATIPELPNAGAYARQTLNPGVNNWTEPVGTNGVVYNLAEILFPDATTDWGWVSGVALLDSATYAAGNQWIHGSLTTPKQIGENDAFRIPVSGLAVTIA